MFTGSIVPIVTPFTKENEIDTRALTDLVKWQIQEGTNAIVCLGTTGEGPTLDQQEKINIIKTCLKASKKKIPIFVGCGTNNTKDTVAFTQTAKDLKADAALVIVPYYNKPTPKGCLEHFRAVAKVGLPVILYHHPGRTGLKLPVETIAQIYDEKLIVAIKESSCDLEYAIELRKASDIPILSGDDDTTLGIIKEGGVGGINIIANVKPKEWREIINLALKGKILEATLQANRLSKLLQGLALETNPGPVKYVLSLMRKCQPKMRLPMVEPEDKNKKHLQKIYKEYFATPKKSKSESLLRD